MSRDTQLLIIGGGPYGLAMTALARHRDIPCVTVGKPMDFWQANMPGGMLLRSGSDWHMDPVVAHTFENYLEAKDLERDDVEPISRDLFVDYAEWFQDRKGIDVLPNLVQRLDRLNGSFRAELDDGDTVIARAVVIAPGFGFFKNIPEEFTKMVPSPCLSHTCDLVDFRSLSGKRCLIVGGRQSAFEWAALMHEQGTATVHLSYRHDTPRFEPSDWSWVSALVDMTVTTPDWYRKLSGEEKEDIGHRFWAEGRLKLEPWLGPRIYQDAIKLWPKSHVVNCRQKADGALRVTLDVGETLTVDHVVLATGYRVAMHRIPYLSEGNVLKELEIRNGYPVLDKHFQSTVPGLFITSFPATQDFGPFFGFVIGSPAAARVIGSYLTTEEMGLD